MLILLKLCNEVDFVRNGMRRFVRFSNFVNQCENGSFRLRMVNGVGDLEGPVIDVEAELSPKCVVSNEVGKELKPVIWFILLEQNCFVMKDTHGIRNSLLFLFFGRCLFSGSQIDPRPGLGVFAEDIDPGFCFGFDICRDQVVADRIADFGLMR
ncbi:hypothetical protein Enr17x_13110 [Gimesia fumaroli]|uniref:Uncharacterized protein n=1 Tax=Gimesia fumaroli TaxID=2527976 RepID=A0A518I8B6_9PLAN|nr:hypothetical protein Enr17x_13110 [Gimesia fumaroli]